jgi:hypothetical protein
MAKGKKVIDITPVEQELAVITYIKEKPELPMSLKDDVVETVGHIFREMSTWKEKVEAIEVIDENDKQGQKIAGDARKVVLKIRTGIKKEIDAKVATIKSERIAPIQREITFWGEIYELIHANLKEIEDIAGKKEKLAADMKAERLRILREKRKELCQPYRNFMPLMVDIGLLSDEEFDTTLKNAKLAQEADRIIKEKEEKEAEDARQEKQRLIRKGNRTNHLSSIGLTYDDESNKYVFKQLDISISDSFIETTEVEEYDTFIKGIASQVKTFKDKQEDIEKEEREKEAKKIADEILEKERAKTAKRDEIKRRIALLDRSKILDNGLHWEDNAKNVRFLCTYDDLYNLSDEDLSVFVKKHNNNVEVQNELIRKAFEEAELQRIKKQADADKIKKDAEDKAEEDRKKAEASKLSDKAKLKTIADLIHEVKLDIKKDFTLVSESGRSIQNSIIQDLANIVKFIDDKTK